MCLCIFTPYHSKNYTAYSRNCDSLLLHKPKPSDEDEHTIPVDVLNKKMPYIWRFLRQGTKKEILRLAELDVNEINIPFNMYDSPSNSKYKKQIKTLKKKYKYI